MHIEEFSIGELKEGSKIADLLDITSLPGGDTLRIPLLAAKGKKEGPTISVLAGVHGDEFEGIQAVREVFSGLDTDVMHGTFIGVPVANPPAVAVGTRTSPIDGLNLARTFPGDPDGSVSERIAHYVAQTIIGPADFMIDLHTAGARSTMPLFCGYSHRDGSQQIERSREAALAFGAVGADVVVGHTVKPGVTRVNRGTTVEEARNREIPCMYTESTGGGWLRSDVVSFYTSGVVNVMKHLGILPGEPDRASPKRYLVGPGYQIVAPVSGFLLSQVNLLDRVKAGDLLGTIVGMLGETLGEIRSEHDGWLIMARCTPTVYSGEKIYNLVLSEAAA